MILWIAVALLTLAMLAWMLHPLLIRPAAMERRIGYDLAVFQDQLGEIDRDLASGLLNAEQAESARIEIRRRMLLAGSRDDGNEAPSAHNAKAARLVAAALAVVIPAGALGLYAQLGTPGMPDRPHAQVQAEAQTQNAAMGGVDHQGAANVSAMVEQLAARLQAAPDDAAGWAMLGKSYSAIGRSEDAIGALTRALELDSRNVDLWGSLGEAMLATTQGMVTPEARDTFLTALRIDPRDPRARFYLAIARMQIGDARGAVAIWKDLDADSNPDAPWVPVIRQHIEQAAAQGGFDPATIAPRSEFQLVGTAAPAGGPMLAPGSAHPTTDDNSQADVVAKRIAELAERLAKDPKDAEGWSLLGRSYRNIGENARAKEALARAAALAPKDVAVQMAYAEAIITLAPDSDTLPAEFVTVMRDVLKVAPDHADGLYYVGLAEIEAGRKAEGKAHWMRLLASLDPKSPEYVSLKQEVDKLGSP